MFDVSVLLLLLLSGAGAFLIQNARNGLCLEDSADTGELLLKKCSLDSASQQWTWMDQGMLMCVASSRCLWAQQRETPQTKSCLGQDVAAEGLMWDYYGDRLISRNNSLLLSVKGQELVLTQHMKHSKWSFLDDGDERLRLRRGSEDSDQYEFEEEETQVPSGMTDEQRDYLRWYYRTEDPTIWKFVLLAVSFIALLCGFLVLGIGTVANKSRKEIAKYKAAASLINKKREAEEMQAVSQHADSTIPPPSDWQVQERRSSASSRDNSTLKAGNISVTWKDGNTSLLYSVPAEVEKQENEQVKMSTFQQEDH